MLKRVVFGEIEMKRGQVSLRFDSFCEIALRSQSK